MSEDFKRDFRKALGQFPTGVTVITTVEANGRPRGFTANSFTSVSLDPPLLLVCLANSAASRAVFCEGDGFAVNVQHDYFAAIDTTNFIWLRRVINSESWRSVFVYYEDGFSPADLTPEWVVSTRDSLAREWIQGNVGGWADVDERRALVSENIDFLDRFAYETRGLWHMIGDGPDGTMIEYGMGGPFVNYSFYDQETGRVYMIDGMVFAPNYDKREFLRQMEVIAHTFRSKAEAAGPGDSEAIQAGL